MTPWNRNTYTLFIDNGLVYSEWRREIVSFSMGGGLAKNIEKHCHMQTLLSQRAMNVAADNQHMTINISTISL